MAGRERKRGLKTAYNSFQRRPRRGRLFVCTEPVGYPDPLLPRIARLAAGVMFHHHSSFALQIHFFWSPRLGAFLRSDHLQLPLCLAGRLRGERNRAGVLTMNQAPQSRLSQRCGRGTIGRLRCPASSMAWTAKITLSFETGSVPVVPVVTCWECSQSAEAVVRHRTS